MRTHRTRTYNDEQVAQALAMYDEREDDGTPEGCPRWRIADIAEHTGVSRGSLNYHVQRTGRSGRYRQRHSSTDTTVSETES